MNQPREQQDPRRTKPQPPFPPQEQSHPGSEAAMTPKADHGETSYKGFGRLRDKVALITGADSGIGRAVALAFAREGADIVVAYLEEHDDAAETRRLVEEAGRKALLIPGDIADDGHCAKLVSKTMDQFGHLDILVNNAAYQGPSVEHVEEIDPARVMKTLTTNIGAMFFLVNHALPHMKEGGSIINVASIQAYQPSAAILDYASTKGAIVTFTKGLAQHVIQRGIRVNCVAPGPVWTPLVAQSFDAEKNANFGKNSPMERPAQPAELAPAFVFLASQESSYVNGEVLGVTGGKPLA
jgi:NAD(P)-dependent dehydrogenase (short-subunit alcohol dehydrogenase family)